MSRPGARLVVRRVVGGFEIVVAVCAWVWSMTKTAHELGGFGCACAFGVAVALVGVHGWILVGSERTA